MNIKKSNERISVQSIPRLLLVYAGIVLMLFSTTIVFGQTSRSITGTVTSKADGQAISGASIIVEGATNIHNSNEYITIIQEQALGSESALYDANVFEVAAHTDWINQMFYDDAVTQNYAWGNKGRTESFVYAMSINYTGQEGIVGGPDVSNYEPYGFRINTEHKFYDNVLRVGQHLNFNYIKNNGISVGNGEVADADIVEVIMSVVE